MLFYHSKTRPALWVILFLLISGLRIYAVNKILINTTGNNRFTVSESSFAYLRITNSITSFNTLTVKTEKGDFVELFAQSYSKSLISGNPQLPVLSKIIEIPAGATPEVKVISYDMKEITLSELGISQKLLPTQPPIAKSGKKEPFTFNQQVYETNSFYHETLAHVEVAGYMRGSQLANLVISPVEYNPVTNKIRVYNNLVVEIQFKGADKVKTDEIKAKTYSAYFNKSIESSINCQQHNLKNSDQLCIPEKYVIVSDPMFRAVLQPFIQWKIKRGFKVIEAYTTDPKVGKTANSIKAYLQNLYNSASSLDPAPAFVLFVGDLSQIPSFACGSHVSDLYYCEYTGDYLPDAYFGRFSANNVAELLPQINKTLSYEKFRMPDPSYLNEVVMIAGADDTHQLTWANGQIKYGSEIYFNEAHKLTSHTYLQPEPTGANYTQKVFADINKGAAFVNYTAHATIDGWTNPLFSSSDVAKLANKDKYGLMVGNGCQTNTFNLNCFGETLLRAENKGALGYIGASDFSYWDEDFIWAVGNGPIVANPTYDNTGLGAYDRIFHDHGEPRSEWYSTMGQMVFAGNLAVQESNSGLKKYYWETYCLLGDPSTMIYFSKPAALTADYPPFIPIKATSFEIKTEPYAVVATSKNNILYGVAEADANGLATIMLHPFTEPGFATIVVTKQNRAPFIDSVLVSVPKGPFLVLDKLILKDAAGKRIDTLNSGELFSLDLTIKNIGNADAFKITSTISTNDPYVSISDNSHLWPLISANSSLSAQNAFTIKVNENIPDLHIVRFALTSVGDTNIFTSEFYITAHAPDLHNGIITLDDATSGNGNGMIDPGETIAITVPTTNIGHCASKEITTQLFVFGKYIKANSQPRILGILAPGATGISTFSFTVDNDAPKNSSFSVFVAATAGAYNSVSSIQPVIGPQIEDFETSLIKNNWHLKGYNPWQISPSARFEGQQGASSGNIANSQQSELNIAIQILLADTISFFRKVSSEYGYDFLKFNIDGVEMGSWSGEKAWSKVSFPVSAGSHTFSWIYTKDEATFAGKDAAWIDYIKFPPFSEILSDTLSVHVIAVPSTICKGSQTQLFALASGGKGEYNYTWKPSPGEISSKIFNPVVEPSMSTTFNVQVSDSYNSTINLVSVDVEQIPETPVVTVNEDHLNSSAFTGNQWYNSSGPIAGATAQTLYPVQNDYFYVITTGAAGCLSSASNIVAFNTTIKSINSNDISLFPNPCAGTLIIEYSLKSGGYIKIEMYNSIGNLVSVIDEGEKKAGTKKAYFNGKHLASGIYYIKFFGNESISFSKVIIQH